MFSENGRDPGNGSGPCSRRHSSRNDDVYYVYVDNSYTPDDYYVDANGVWVH